MLVRLFWLNDQLMDSGLISYTAGRSVGWLVS
jgi:hypothetical protein